MTKRPAGAVGLVVIGCVALAVACDTPVYRYAMYRWEPVPYEVYYFHRGEASEAVKARHDQLRELPYDDKPANFALLSVDLDADPELRNVPPDVRQAWRDRKLEAPSYLVVSPVGAVVYGGAIDDPQWAAMIESPARQKLAEELGRGAIGALIVLLAPEQPLADTDADREGAAAAAAANRQARQAMTELVEGVGSGKIQLYHSTNEPLHKPSDRAAAPGLDAPEKTPSEKTPAAKTPAAKTPVGARADRPGAGIGVVFVARDDPAEQWLVRSLLTVEGDLATDEFRYQPMVFVAYGRGRVLPPFIGKGVRSDNVLSDIEFISGACECTVREQNPGVYLPIRFDWATAAEAMADRFGSEEGNETQFGIGDLFPQIALPPVSETPAAGDLAAVESGADGDAAGVDPAGGPLPGGRSPSGTSPSGTSSGEPGEPGETVAAPGDSGRRRNPEPLGIGAAAGSEPPVTGEPAASPGDSTRQTASRSEPGSAPRADSKEQAFGSVYVVMGGLGIALVVLFGATFLVLRPR